MEDEMGYEVVSPANAAGDSSAASGNDHQALHPHYGLDATAIARLTKRVSVGDELIWCPACKGDLIII